MPPFVIAKQLEHGTKNPIVARLTLQTLQILEKCNLSKERRDEVGGIFVSSLVKKLLRCWEIEARLRAEFDRRKASYKAPAPGAAAIELPQIPRLEEECHNFLYEAKNYLRDLLKVFNLLHGTDFPETSHWVPVGKRTRSVMSFASDTFGEDHINAIFFNQLPTCIAPFIELRNAVEHPDGHAGKAVIQNFTFDANGALTDPRWSREKDGATVYGSLPILADMQNCIHNLLILGEDVLVMWAIEHLAMPGITEMTATPQEQRDPNCAIKYVIKPSAAMLGLIEKSAISAQR